MLKDKTLLINELEMLYKLSEEELEQVSAGKSHSDRKSREFRNLPSGLQNLVLRLEKDYPELYKRIRPYIFP